jgi:hypothetical protein
MAQAQDKEWFFRAGLGYAIPMAGQSLSPESGFPYSGSIPSTIKYDMKDVSFSTGTSVHVGLGYMLNRNVGIQVEAQVGIAPTTYKLDAYSIPVQYGNGTIITSDQHISHQADMPVNLMPSLLLQMPGDPWTIYTRAGLVLPLSSDITQEKTTVNSAGTGATTVHAETWKLSSSFGVGLTAALGVQYAINEKVSVWGEVSGISMSLYIKQKDLTRFEENGTSYNLSQISGTKNYTYSKNATVDTVNGSVQPAYSLPFSNVSFNVGVRYSIPRAKRVNTEAEGPKLRRGSVI